MNPFDAGFEGKVALVTGGASGIGRATAEKLAGEGATVIISDLDESRLKAEADALGAEAVVLDVSDPEAWEAAIAGIEERHGGLHLVHLNAGITTFRAENSLGPETRGFDLGELPLENYRRIMGANVDGVILGARACCPLIARSGGGAIISTASVAGILPFPPDPVYTATKHAVVGFVRSMAPLLSAQGIGCHAVLPGVVDTGLLGEGMADQARSMGIPIIAPEDIADAVLVAARSSEPGGLFVCLAGRPPARYQFNPIEGLGIPEPN